MYIFIVDPDAGHGKGRKVWGRVEKYLELKDIKYSMYLLGTDINAEEIVARITKNCTEHEHKDVVVIGGDEAFGDVLDAFSHIEDVSLGVIPAGMNNNLAKSMKISYKTMKALKKVLKPENREFVDYGIISCNDEILHHRRFAVGAGVGVDAQIYQYFHEKKHILKLPNMIYQVLKAKSIKGYIVLDRSKKIEFNHIYFISVQIHPYECGGMKLIPKANFKDGRLSICVMHYRSKLKFLTSFIRTYFGVDRTSSTIRTYFGNELKIHLDEPLIVHSDGEIIGKHTDFEFVCINKKVEILH